MAREHPNRLRIGVLISLTAVLLTLVGMELFARFILQVEPRQERYLLHPRMGWEWAPGYAALEIDHGVEYYLKISEQGLPHSPHYAIPKPEGTFRILALGDSVTHGPGAGPDEKFVRQMEVKIQEKLHERRVEVINGGTDDYGTEQELIWLQERGLRFEPDVILLTVYMNDSRPTERTNAITATGFNLLISRSAAYYYYIQSARELLLKEETSRDDFRFRYKDEFEDENWRKDSANLTKLIQTADSDWGLAWTDEGMAALEENLKAVIRFVEEQDIPILISLTPVAVQVYAETETQLGTRALDYPQLRLKSVLQADEFPVVDLLPVLREQRDATLFIDQAHYTVAGHTIVADVLVAALLEGGFLPVSQTN